MTGVGAGAALTPALDAGGFGGDTDGFYQRRGCGLSKVSKYSRATHMIIQSSPCHSQHM